MILNAIEKPQQRAMLLVEGSSESSNPWCQPVAARRLHQDQRETIARQPLVSLD